MTEWLPFLWLFLAGCVAGTLNVIAGGGSFLTLPILIFMGLPATVANGTNRVGILLQNVGAVWGFHHHRVLNWRWALYAAVPATIGAGFGTYAALLVSDLAFRRILSFLMVAITLLTLLRKARVKDETSATNDAMPLSSIAGLALAFFFVGLYGGFVQAGVGFLILTATTWAGLDLVRGNAIKVLCVLAFTALSLSIFAWQGMVEWKLGLVLAAGTVLGGQVGVRLTTLKGHRWVKGVVTVTVIAFAIRLWMTG
jgi:uncharacterized membrane protein YfcA